MPPTLSYAQRFEDLHLLRCFGDQADGFYIDIGSGHPVVDNVSFAFYLRGWSGITVEPNPYLSRLSRAVRPRDRHRQQLVGAQAGDAPFYLVQEFHGFSTMIEQHAARAQTDFGKASEKLMLPVTTLRELCAQHVSASIDFLKVDVEGGEKDVLQGGDWKTFRPKIVLVEALAPYTLAPAWHDWEPLLTQNGYRFVFFDSLNRYYAAEEAAELARRFEDAPDVSDNAVQFGVLKPALDEGTHPDRPLATLLSRAAMTRLPFLPRGTIVDLLIAELAPTELDKPAGGLEIAAAWERLFGRGPTPDEVEKLALPQAATMRQLYALIAESDAFRTACGRISASYAW
ncbi:MAG TPA: FkbM family methyltransferase [Xanthobacteraceae bacterium]|nr:FkbM family methyltransferase [Xanthobacteraceae bacterium]